MQILFEILEILIERSSMTVKFINPYGPIATGKKTESDFIETEQIFTGKIVDGQKIYNEISHVINDNPNDDLIYNVNIPLNELGEFIKGDELIEHISRHYPENAFKEYNKKEIAKENTNIEDYSDLLNVQHSVNIIEESPMPVSEDDTTGSFAETI